MLNLSDTVLIVTFRNLALTILLFVACPIVADSAKDMADFKNAYASYESAATQDDASRTVEAAETVFVLGEELFPDGHRNRAALAYNYGGALLYVGEKNAAKRVLKIALSRFENLVGKDSLDLIDLLMDLGEASSELHDPRRQQRYYSRALRIVKQHHGRDSIEYGRLSLRAGVRIMDYARSPAARGFLRDGYKILLAQLGPENPETGQAAFYNGKLEIARYRHEVARDYLLRALDAMEESESSSNHIEMLTHAFLVETYEMLDESDKATEHCLAIGKMSPNSPEQDYQPLFRRVPDYPQGAFKRGIEGSVTVEFDVDDRGFVVDPEVVSTEDTELFEESALIAVKGFRFAPRFIDGVPVVNKNVRYKIEFNIDD